jgi:ADP-ribose pyrophosphatase
VTDRHAYDVLDSRERFSGHIIKVVTDVVRMPGGGTGERDVVRHPGAVGALAIDGEGRALLIKQYRHAVGEALWEIPAGIRDVAGEPAEETARRELLEETGWTARTWSHLATIHSTPGGSDEVYEIFLARDLVEAAERPEVVDEEADLELRWVPLADACAQVLDGRITNAMCAIAVLAAARLDGV